MTAGISPRKRIFALVVGGAGVVVLAAAGAWFWSKSNEGARPDDVDQVRLGQAVYVKHCADCHGARLEGQASWQQRKPDGKLPAPPHDETGHTWHHPDKQLFAVVKHGLAPMAGPVYATDMPAYGTILTDQDIWAVIAFIKSRWPPDIQDRQSRLNR